MTEFGFLCVGKTEGYEPRPKLLRYSKKNMLKLKVRDGNVQVLDMVQSDPKLQVRVLSNLTVKA